MTIKTIPPSDFNEIPWKNGKGTTLELAISDGGDMNDFDWRLSIATVAQDGAFSNFPDITRNLILIEGAGIMLDHDEGSTTDALTSPLSIARFNGGSMTKGTLINGPIKDFNVMAKASKYRLRVDTYTDIQTITIPPCDICFAYSLDSEIHVGDQRVPAGHLLKMTGSNQSIITGQQMILILLNLVE